MPAMSYERCGKQPRSRDQPVERELHLSDDWTNSQPAHDAPVHRHVHGGAGVDACVSRPDRHFTAARYARPRISAHELRAVPSAQRRHAGESGSSVLNGDRVDQHVQRNAVGGESGRDGCGNHRPRRGSPISALPADESSRRHPNATGRQSRKARSSCSSGSTR